MKAPVPFQVYLQALGGKFLGPNAYTPTGISISLKYSRGTIPLSYVVTPNDGSISAAFTNGSSSFMPILTMPLNAKGNPTVNYLTPIANTIVGTTKIITPDANEWGILTVSIPTPSGKPLLITETVLLSPLQLDYKITVVVPGLLLTANKTILIPPGYVSVFVNMMCGCKVTYQLPTSFWTYTDFTVFARVLYKDGSNKIFPLDFDQQANDSLFSGPVGNAGNISSINFCAQQMSTGNYGALEEKW